MFSAALKHVMTGQAAIPGDPLLASNVLLLKTIGTNNATNASFVDSSSNNFTVTRTGDVTQGAFSPYVPTGYWSNYFDGSGDWLRRQTFDLSGKPVFTAECWFNPDRTSGINSLCGILTTRNSGVVSPFNICHNGSGQLAWLIDGSGGGWNVTGGTVTAGQWHHVAISSNGTTIRLFLNGTQLVSYGAPTWSGTDYSQMPFIIGANLSENHFFQGFISNARFIIGTAVYTSNFTPPTTPLTAITNTVLLTCQDNRFIDRSSNNFTLTRTGDVSVRRFAPFGLSWDSSLGGSAYFDGSGDYIQLPNTPELLLGTADFTIEFWVNPQTTSSAVHQIFFVSYGGSERNGVAVGMRNGYMWWLIGNGSYWVFERNAGSDLPINTWNHVAVTRSNGTARLFVNGVQIDSVADSTNITQGTGWTVGAYYSNGYNLTGHMANVRVVKGVAVYTSNFTPPTSPVTAISGTSLLLNFDNAAVYDATRSSNLTLNGTTQTSTAQKNYADTSVALSTAAGNRGLRAVDRPELRFGTGDFTAELWWRPSGLSGYQTIINKGYASTGGLALQSNANRIEVYVNGSTFTAPANRVVTNNAWNHIALVRSAGTVTLWVNGLSAGSVANSANLSITDDLLIGWETQGGNFYPASGNVEDVRFSRTARYTAAFTPPARALPVTAG